MIVNKIKFPEFKGISCNMMPFIQGDSSSLPEGFELYASIIDENYLEKGEILGNVKSISWIQKKYSI